MIETFLSVVVSGTACAHTYVVPRIYAHVSGALSIHPGSSPGPSVWRFQPPDDAVCQVRGAFEVSEHEIWRGIQPDCENEIGQLVFYHGCWCMNARMLAQGAHAPGIVIIQDAIDSSLDIFQLVMIRETEDTTQGFYLQWPSARR